MSAFRRFIKSSGVFFIGNVLSKIIVFFLLPIYTKYIPTESFGYYDLSVTYVTVISSLLFFEVWTTIMRYMYDSNIIEKRYKVIFSGSEIFALSTCVYILLGFIVSRIIDIKYLGIIMLWGIMNNIVYFYTSITRGYERNIEYVISGIINTIVMAVSNITLIVFLQFDFSSLYIAAILGCLCQILYLEFHIHVIPNLHFKYFDRQLIRTMFLFTLPLCLNSIAYWLLTSYNKIAIHNILSVSDNGLFAIGNKFSAIITIVTTCFSIAWQDVSFSRKIDDPTNSDFYSRACQLYLRFLCIGCILAFPIIKIIFPFIINEAYSSTASLIPLSLITTIACSYAAFIGNIFYAIKDTKAILIATVISCIFNVIFCGLLIHQFGLNGANLSMLLSFIINIIIKDRILYKQVHIKTNPLQLGILFFWLGISSYVYLKLGLMINIIWLLLCTVIACFIFQDYLLKLYSIITEQLMKLYHKPPFFENKIIEVKTEPIEPIELFKKKSDCCGCAACMNICPKQAIIMKEDEKGFFYPVIQQKMCSNCNLCKNVCTFKKDCSSINNEVREPFASYITSVNRRPQNIINARLNSVDNLFMELSSHVLEKKGIVFGPSYNKKLEPIHIYIENKDQIKKIQGIKTAQSNMNNTYIKIKSFLGEGRWVLFFGTPCQVAELKSFLGHDCCNLIAVDIICPGVSSTVFFKGYINYLEDKFKGNIVNYRFNEKNNDWGYVEKVVYIKKGTLHVKFIPSISSYYNNYIMNGVICRESCYECKYRSGSINSDLTIGTNYDVDKVIPKEERQEEGALLFVNSVKGLTMVNDLKEQLNLTLLDRQKAKSYKEQLNHPIIKSNQRGRILTMWHKAGHQKLADHYYQQNRNNIKFYMIKTFFTKNIRKLIYRDFIKGTIENINGMGNKKLWKIFKNDIIHIRNQHKK